MSLSDKNRNMPWQTWPPEERTKKQAAALSEQYKSSILSHKLEQYRRQLTWEKVKNYAYERGITIIGDLPIYASPEGADTWAHPELFTLTEEGQPYLHAAVPPDYFNEEGQDWGNPLYNWDTEKAALLSFGSTGSGAFLLTAILSGLTIFVHFPHTLPYRIRVSPRMAIGLAVRVLISSGK
jgi:4-alpha-glucanotransferase